MYYDQRESQDGTPLKKPTKVRFHIETKQIKKLNQSSGQIYNYINSNRNSHLTEKVTQHAWKWEFKNKFFEKIRQKTHPTIIPEFKNNKQICMDCQDKQLKSYRKKIGTLYSEEQQNREEDKCSDCGTILQVLEHIQNGDLTPVYDQASSAHLDHIEHDFSKKLKKLKKGSSKASRVSFKLKKLALDH